MLHHMLRAAAGNRGGWTPEQITTSLWLDASDNSTITEVSGGVSNWADKSGNGRDASQGTSADRPALVSAAKNGLDVIRWDGTLKFLAISATTLSGSGNISVFAAIEQTGVPPNNAHVIAQEDGFILKSEQTSTARPRFQPYISGGYKTAEGSSKLSAPSIIAGVKGDSSGVLYVNGSNSGSYSFSGSISAPGTVIDIGKFPEASDTQFIGDIYEIVVVAGETLTDDRQLIEGYLAHKWGLESTLPSGHPYKTGAP